MGWETRRRGGHYYTRSRREGGRVVREYVGSGYTALLAASMDKNERREKAENRERDAKVRKTMAAVDALIAEAGTEARSTLEAALEAAGYHQHKRGEWRKQRVRTADQHSITTGGQQGQTAEAESD